MVTRLVAVAGLALWTFAIPAVTGPPGAPGTPSALAGEASATVYWTASGGAVSNYTVTASPGGANATVGGSSISAVVSGLSDGTSYTFGVTASNGSGPGPASAASNSVVPGRGAYQALVPARILDSRLTAGTLGAGSSLNVQVLGQGGVPASGVSAVMLNVTVTDTTAPSFLIVWPAGLPQPLASNLNWTAGKTVPNLVQVALGTGGKLSIYNQVGTTDVVIDVAGYIDAATVTAQPDGLYHPVVPDRVLDTRSGNGAPQAQVGPGHTITVQMTGRGGSGIPAAGVSAVVLNVTVTNATAASYLTVWPEGVQQPVASNLNFLAGQNTPNRVIVKLGSTGKVSFFNAAGSVDVIADVGGWFTDATPDGIGSTFTGLTPARILDTRPQSQVGPFSTPFGPRQTRNVVVAGQGQVPSMNSTPQPTAVVLNVTVTNPTAPSFLTVWPSDAASQPTASDLNYVAGQTSPNLVVVRLGADGSVSLYNAAGSTDVIIDVVGYYN